jgi:phospholipase/lecithinase/hemolysin
MEKSLLLLLLAAAAAASMKSCHGYQYNASQGPLVTSVIVFGDSIVDPGNNNDLLTLIKANHPPYGKDFIHHQSTGRYSNGLIPSDLIGEYLHTHTHHHSYSFPLSSKKS